MKINNEIKLIGTLILVVLVGVGIYTVNSKSTDSNTPKQISIAISPYQDLAMITNIQPLGLDKKYNTNVSIKTLAWEDVVPAVLGGGADVGFASYNEYLKKKDNINNNSNDPLVFFYPAYVFKGGAFVSFKANVPVLTKENISDCTVVNKFLNSKIGLQKNSVYEMMVFHLAKQCKFEIKNLKIVDVPLDQGFLASQTSSLDVSSAGLPQVAETQKRGGRVVLDMETIGFSDITGFVAKQSTLTNKKQEVNDLVKMWFDSVDYVFTDLDNNSVNSRAYLDKFSSTKYSLDGYKTALSNEYFPRSIEEANKELIQQGGKYNYEYIGGIIQNYLLANSKIKNMGGLPAFIVIK